MSSYQPLTGDDPFPGSASDFSGYANVLRTKSDTATSVGDAVRQVSDASSAVWVGDAADLFRACCADGSGRARTAATMLTTTAKLLTEHADVLTTAQLRGRVLAGQATSNRGQQNALQYRLTSLLQSPVVDPVEKVRLQQSINDCHQEHRKLTRQFDDVVRKFTEDANKTRKDLLEIASNEHDASGSLTAWTYRQVGPRPDSAKDATYYVDKHGNLVLETKGKTTVNGRTVETTDTRTITDRSIARTKSFDYEKDRTEAAKDKTEAAKDKSSTAAKVAKTVTVTAAEKTLIDKSAGPKATFDKQGKNFGTNGEIGLDASVSAKAHAGVTRDGVEAGVNAKAAIQAEAKLNGSYNSKYVKGEASLHATAGAEASVDAVASLGLNGAKLAVGGKAFVGGEVGGDANINLGGVGAGGHAAVTYGLGGEFNVDGEVSLNKVSVKADLGATLGLGFHASIDIDIHPKEILHNITSIFDW